MKKTIFGAGLIIAGSFGIAVGNLEETIFYIGNTGTFHHSSAYYMFWAFLLLGIGSCIGGALEKK